MVWGVRFERVNPGGQDLDLDGFATQVLGAATTTNGTNGFTVVTTIALTKAQMDALESGDPFRCEVERVTTNVGDTMTDIAEVLWVHGRR